MAENYAHKQDGSRSVSIAELTKEELVNEVLRLRGQLKKKNSFGLVFERQTEDAILNRKNAIPVLVENKNKLVNNEGEDNLLLIGDNFDSLTCLLKTHRGKVDVIYIDPPYNTGNEDFIYNDRYINPEDSFRHSKWLSFMEARLILAKELLSEEGVIFVSIDDNELYTLKILMDSIFGMDNFLGNIIWQSTAGSNTGDKIITITEYILSYGKNGTKLQREPFENNGKMTNIDEHYDRRGHFALDKLDSKRLGSHYSKALSYELTAPDGSILLPGGGEPYFNWLWSKDKVQWGVENDFIVFKKDKNNKWTVYNKRYEKVNNKDEIAERGQVFKNLIPSSFATTSTGSKEVAGLGLAFDYPKSVKLMKRLINLHPNKNAIVMDFFAGSGTTGHAVLELNKEDGGNRKFILCTNDEAGIGETVTYERIKRVITGKDWTDGKEHDAHEASLHYYNVQFIEREKAQSLIADHVDGLINIAESCFNELYKGEMSSLWNNSSNHFTALLKDPWGVEELSQALASLKPSTLSLYVHDNGADYSQELSEIESQGWDITYISINDFIFNVISFVDEKLNINLAESNSKESDTPEIIYGNEDASEMELAGKSSDEYVDSNNTDGYEVENEDNN